MSVATQVLQVCNLIILKTPRIKNSWGLSNDYKGYLYMTKEFMKYKATAIMVHKNAVPKAIAKKLAI